MKCIIVFLLALQLGSCSYAKPIELKDAIIQNCQFKNIKQKSINNLAICIEGKLKHFANKKVISWDIECSGNNIKNGYTEIWPEASTFEEYFENNFSSYLLKNDIQAKEILCGSENEASAVIYIYECKYKDIPKFWIKYTHEAASGGNSLDIFIFYDISNEKMKTDTQPCSN